MNISVIIVTYNRKELLKKCLTAVLSQSIKIYNIYVIDNASTDGTDSIINEFVLIHKNVKYVRLNSNTGGAGGFYSGIKLAFEDKKNDVFWVMDDDGIPNKDCLEMMLKYIHSYAFISPLVLNIDNKTEMAFSTLKLSKLDEIRNKYPTGIIRGHANPFNGVLFRRDLIQKIGFPIKDMFIWGDENEYEARINANGYEYVTVIDAIHYHPKDRLVLYPDFMNKKCIVYVESELKRYCKYRNFAYVLYKYKHWYNVALYIFRYIYFYLINRKFDTKGLLLFYKAVKDGLNNNFENHKKYL